MVSLVLLLCGVNIFNQFFVLIEATAQTTPLGILTASSTGYDASAPTDERPLCSAAPLLPARGAPRLVGVAARET